MDSEERIRRIMPNNEWAEQSVIGSMIMDREALAVAVELLDKDDFYQGQYGILFEAMKELSISGHAIDVVTLQNKLREKDVSPELSSMEYVGSIVANVPTSANVRYYADIVHDKAVMRRLIKASEEIENECYSEHNELDVILEDTEKKIFNLLQTGKNDNFVSIKDTVMETLMDIERVSKTGGGVTGIPTGFTDIDTRTAGLQPQDLILIAARPSMGKTAFVLNIADHTAFRLEKSVAIFSLEMSRKQLVNRLFAMEAKVNAQDLRVGNLKDSDWQKLVESAGIIGRSKLIIDDTPGITVQQMRSKCRKYKLEQGLDLVIIDYLQLMSGSGRGRGSDSRQQEISDISRGLKALARELNVPVLALSQLSRAPEQRPDHRPMLADLRESGAIEQDADVVMFIYRDDYYNPDSEAKGTAEIITAKQRNGPVGKDSLVWLPQYTRFVNMEKRMN